MTDVNGLRTKASVFGPKETMRRLEASVTSHGMEVFARIDHAAGAEKAGLALRPTELLLFGTAKAGTLLMQVAQTIGIDLPLKALVWQDADGHTWLSYDDPHWLVARHGALGAVDARLAQMTTLLGELAKAATEAT